jgi:hypothetical protein
MEKQVVLFQNLETSKFKSDRVRKTLKAALKANFIGYSFDKLDTNAKIAHFIPPFKYSSVERAEIFGKKIVISAFYTEGEKTSSVSTYRNSRNLSKTNIQTNYLKSFQKAHKILVPCEEYKELLIKKGIHGDKIEIFNPGMNTRIYKYLPESDMELTRRYYSLPEETKILLVFGNPKDKAAMKSTYKLCEMRKDCKIIFLATNEYTVKGFKAWIKRVFSEKTPSNLILTSFKDINVYRSLFKNSRALIYFDSILIDEIQLNEALAAEIQVIGYNHVFSKAFLEKELVLHADNEKDLLRTISDYINYQISGTISNASFYIEENDVKYIGTRLKEIYNNLSKEELEDDRY